MGNFLAIVGFVRQRPKQRHSGGGCLHRSGASTENDGHRADSEGMSSINKEIEGGTLWCGELEHLLPALDGGQPSPSGSGSGAQGALGTFW
jgi:hypothetical protein